MPFHANIVAQVDTCLKTACLRSTRMGSCTEHRANVQASSPLMSFCDCEKSGAGTWMMW